MTPNDPLYAEQWYFTAIGDIERIWDDYSGARIHVGVYDTGLQSNHPDLNGNYNSGLEVVIGGNPVTGEPNVSEPDPHGTTIGGLIAAETNNGEGGAGIAFGASLTSIDILDPSSPVYPSPDQTNFLSAIHQMTNFDVTNNSWNASGLLYLAEYNANGTGLFAQIDQEFAYVSQTGRGGLGTVIVQAVANDNQDGQGSGLNSSRFTITVAAIQQDGFPAVFSNYGACVLATAPGTEIVNADLIGSDGYASGDYVAQANDLAGTSFSAPMVTGVVALMLDANPNLGWRDVQNIIAASATHTGSAIGATTPESHENFNWLVNDAANWNGGGMHFSNDYGYGLVNAYGAVRMAEAWSLFMPAAQTSANEHYVTTGLVNFNQAITHDGSTNTYDLVLTGDLDVEHLDLFVNLQHSDFTQLNISLVSPGGKVFNLADGTGSAVSTADPPLQWMYGIDGLRGEEAAGTWHVTIADSAAGDTGTLNWLYLTAFGATPSDDTVYHYTDEFLSMATLSGESARTALADADGGTDWIDASAVSGDFALNLAEGAVSKVDGADWFTIAGGTLIENAVTGDGDDTITGNSAANTLNGMRGNDKLNGAGGADFLYGGSQEDTLTGGLGQDDLTGGPGADIFDFNSKTESPKGAHRDIIMDFEQGIDNIDLAGIDANSKLNHNQHFTFIGDHSFRHRAGELHFVELNLAGTMHDKTIVQGDVNGDGKVDFDIELLGLHALHRGDFIL